MTRWRVRREALGLSRSELARLAHVSEDTLLRLERGEAVSDRTRSAVEAVLGLLEAERAERVRVAMQHGA